MRLADDSSNPDREDLDRDGGWRDCRAARRVREVQLGCRSMRNCVPRNPYKGERQRDVLASQDKTVRSSALTQTLMHQMYRYMRNLKSLNPTESI